VTAHVSDSSFAGLCCTLYVHLCMYVYVCCVAVCCRLLQLLLDTQKSYNDLLHSCVTSTRNHSQLLRSILPDKQWHLLDMELIQLDKFCT